MREGPPGPGPERRASGPGCAVRGPACYAAPMGELSWQEILGWGAAIALGVSLAACAGLRAWLPLLVAGAGARLGLVHLGESFAALGSTPALVFFSVATVVEIVGDKFPAVDHALDAVGTVARPAAGTLLAAAAMWQIEEPAWALGLGLIVGAPVAAAPHVVKTAARGASSTFTFGLVNPVLSVVEDAVALALAAVAFVAPFLVLAVVAVVGAIILRRVLRSRASAPVASASPEPPPASA